MWLAEIHVAPERSVLSAPLTLASAIAARTKRMKIGTGGPGAAAVPPAAPRRGGRDGRSDQPGRLIFGVGRSGFPRTYEAYGVPYGESRERFAETLEILKQAWTEDRASPIRASITASTTSQLTPKPYQKPWPEIRIAANSADTFPAIAKLGHGVFVAVRLGTLEELEPNITRLPRRLEGSRASRRGQGVSARPGLCRRNRRGGARRAGRKHHVFLPLSRRAARGFGDPRRRARGRGPGARGRRLQDITYEDALREKIIVGSPERVTDRLMGLKENSASTASSAR